MALAVVAASVYAALNERLPQGWAVMALVVLGCALVCIWAGFYATYTYRVEAGGITRSLFGRRRTRVWSSLARASVYHHEAQGVAVCRITLEYPEGIWRISSELFDPDSVRELADELREAGLLTEV